MAITRYLDGCPIIDDETLTDGAFKDQIFNFNRARGYIERDYNITPIHTFGSPPSEMEVYTGDEFEAKYDAKDKAKSWLDDLGGDVIETLDQGQVGYCWAHSTTHAMMFIREALGLPYVPLSAYSIAATIKKGADQGGWCGLSAEFAREKGIVPQDKWPQGDRNYQKYANDPAIWELASKFKIVADWVDLAQQVYDQNMKQSQVFSALIRNEPCALDFNWWGHSVCGIRPIRIERGSYGIKIKNSWGKSWGQNGFGILRGSQAIPNGAIGIRGPSLKAA